MIDAHQHFWRLARGDYGWLTPALARHPPRLRRRPTWRRCCDRAGIDGTVLVQAAPTRGRDRVPARAGSRADGRVRGVVGWADLDGADAPARIAELAREPLLRGCGRCCRTCRIREWMLGDAAASGRRGDDRELGLAFDALVKPHHLPRAAGIRAAPSRAADRDRPWRQARHRAPAPSSLGAATWRGWRAIRACTASCPGWPPKPGPAGPVDALRPYVDAPAARISGRPRMMWGSDWPVLNLAGDYRALAGRLRRMAGRPAGPRSRQVYGARTRPGSMA